MAGYNQYSLRDDLRDAIQLSIWISILHQAVQFSNFTSQSLKPL